MKRLCIILGLLCLLVDLADDDFIGQVKNVAPQGASVSAQQQADDDLSNAFYGNATVVTLLATYLEDLGGDFHYRPGAVEVSRPCRRVYFGHFCSSGGIPL